MSSRVQTDGREDASLRAPVYRLLAGLLVRPPDAAFLQSVAALQGDRTDFGQAIEALARMASLSDLVQVEREHNALFIGVTRGELVPYASYYRTGFLHDRPLARVRADLARLALERIPGVAEPEDHIAGLCEVMALLCADDGWPLTCQTDFFENHLAPWAGGFFRDLQAARSARFYRPVAQVALCFLDIERRVACLARDEAVTHHLDISGGAHVA